MCNLSLIEGEIEYVICDTTVNWPEEFTGFVSHKDLINLWVETLYLIFVTVISFKNKEK